MTNTSIPLAVATMTREKLDEELKKRYDSINAIMIYSADEVDILLAKEFDLKITPTKKETTCPQ